MTFVKDHEQHLTDFIQQIMDEYGADDLGSIVAATSPPGWPFDDLRTGNPPARLLARALLAGDVPGPDGGLVGESDNTPVLCNCWYRPDGTRIGYTIADGCPAHPDDQTTDQEIWGRR